VTDPATAGETLYVSAGEADITTSWLLRLFDQVGGGGAPRLGRVVLLRLDDDLITRLEQRSELEDGFRQRLKQNIDRLDGLLTRAKVTFEVRGSATVPPFHGYKYGDVLLRGPWAVDREGRYAARTLLEHLTRDSAPKAFVEAQALFDSAPIVLRGRRPLTVGLLVPLKEEWEQLRQVFPVLEHNLPGPRDHDFYYLLDAGVPGVRIVATFLGEMGPTPANQRANRLIDAFQPQLMVIAGIAGSLDRDVNIGDVVTATEINDFDSTAKAVAGADTFEIRRSGKRLSADYALTQAVIHFSEQAEAIYQRWQDAVRKDRADLHLPPDAEGPRDHAGHVASGNVVAAADAYKEELRRIDRKFLAVEMEAVGVAAASWERQFPVKWLSLRGISDRGDEQKKELDGTQGGAWRRVAMRSAARYLQALLEWEEFQRRIAAPA
jgi:nucleoside phosphorylase